MVARTGTRMVVFRIVAAGQGVGGTEPVLPHTDDLWVSLMRGRSRNRSHSAGFPRKRAIVQAMGRTVRVVNIVHPCRVKSFRKAVSAVMDDLVPDFETIENMNRMIKT